MPSISVVLPVVLDISASAVEIYGASVSNTNPYSITALGANLRALDLSGAFWYIQDASGANPDLVTCKTAVSYRTVTDHAGNTFETDFSFLQSSYESSPFAVNVNNTLNNFVLCSGSGFSSDYASLPNSTYETNSPFYKFANFYQAMLGRLAFDVFGHPLAQAGIENDTDLVASMRADNIGWMLYNALMGLTEAQVRLIYNQMIQQDITRFQDLVDVPTDLSGVVLTNSPHSILFKSGDTITFEVTLASSAVLRGGSGVVSGGTGNVSTNNGEGDSVTARSGSSTVAKTYALNVTLA
jgi:hypothetical protein